jgi:NAD+ synthase (glutamine-hydrolysing)
MSTERPSEPAAGSLARFRDLYRHGFVRVGVAVPEMQVSDVGRNTEHTIALARRAAGDAVAVTVFPELGLTGYSAQDLLHQDAFLRAALDGLRRIVDDSRGRFGVVVVGLPVRVGSQLFNVAAVVHDGAVLGLVPKSYLPNYREFYEKRHFSAARAAVVSEVELFGRAVPFGTDLLFPASDRPDLVLGIEICEDLWTPIPPSTYAAMAGATVIGNLSASNLTIAKRGYRNQLCGAQSARTVSAYLYAGAGAGESTTDLVWDGHALIYENGTRLAERDAFADADRLVTADVDLDRLLADRIRLTSLMDTIEDHRDRLSAVRRVPFTLGPAPGPQPLRRAVSRFPFVPADPAERQERCAEVMDIQVSGLATRLRATGIERVVIGVSGGLDSTQALLVAVRCMDRLHLPRTNVLAYTLPGFATSGHTLANAHRLMGALGVSVSEIDIRPAASQMLRDLDHPAARGEAVYDVAYENVQAGARTSLLFRLANHHGALVVGTGDLSELALGWATFGVGDHMSHYGVNSSVPKTLIQYLVRWAADTQPIGDDAAAVLRSILDTEISPELVPAGADGGHGEGPHQSSEDVVGPYELQDFHLYHVLRFGYGPAKVAFLADHAWRPGAGVAGDPRTAADGYDPATICRWLGVFLHRFFQTSQFKRSTLPDGPKVGSGGSLSPRGDWRAPSDGSSAVWLAELDAVRAELGL